MLKVENISAGYGKKQVLFDVSLEVNKGDVVLLTGGNGSGKSTLLKCIFNLLPLWGGEIQYKEVTTNRLKPSELIHKGIVYIPQKDCYFENLTVIENLQISGNILPKAFQKERIKEVLELTGLARLQKRKPFNLSGGERKILAFGMAFMHKPRLLLFDEPFSGVDAKYRQMIYHLFNEGIISAENAMIIVEHKDENHRLYNKKLKMELGYIKSDQL